jgi:hypothetical protein
MSYEYVSNRPVCHLFFPSEFRVEFRGQTDSLSEIEFRTPYVVAERLIVALMLRFKPAKKVLSDTLRSWHFGKAELKP